MPLSNTQNRISETAHNVADSSKEFVEQHAISTTMAAFGLGVGAGIAIVLLLADSRHQQESSVAHRLGRQVLDALASGVPDKLTTFGK